jgi:cytoskeleton protein RodZ
MQAQAVQGGVGGMLREARERRGVSLRQIANATKISMPALEALERNDIARLPGGIFSRAFVRAYAAEVGLDPEQVVHEFIGQFPQESVTAGHPTSRRIEDPDEIDSNRRAASAVVWLLAVSIPVAGALLYFGLGRHGSAPNAVPPVPAAAAAPSSASGTTPSDSAGTAVPPSITPLADAAGDHFVLVDVTASAPCWVSATVDGEQIFDRELQPGDRRQFSMHRDLVLRAGNAAAVTLAFDGADARPLGKSGETVTVRLNLANYKEYLTVR